MLYANLARHGLLTALREKPAAVVAARVLPEGLIANLIAGTTGIPSVVFAHGEEITTWTHAPGPSRRRSYLDLWKQRLLWQTYSRCDRIIANSRFTQGLLHAGLVDPSKVAVVHPGTDPERFLPQEKDPELLDRYQLRGRQVLLTVGRLSRRKGQDVMLRALPQIVRTAPDVVYAIAGTGDYDIELRRLVRLLGVERHVRFLGGVADELLPAVYNLADVFVMPNRTLPESNDVEGFGIVFSEAGACAKPIVAGRSGGVSEAVLDGDTGLLVDGARPYQVAAAVIRLLNDRPLARRLGHNARRRVCRELTWDHSAARIETCIDQAVRSRRGLAPQAAGSV
jgi:phosphatidylinositol alpha-1,6-mannosyltransferase